MRNRYLEDIRPALDAGGVPWELRPGKKHDKVLVAGRLATVLPHGSYQEDRKRLHNCIAGIKRIVREVRG